MQGTDKLHLVHLPKFRLASHRYQVVMTGELDSACQEQYVTLRNQNRNCYFLLENVHDDTLENLIKSGTSLAVNIFNGSGTKKPPVAQGTLNNVQVTIRKSLAGDELDTAYPIQMPFYIYGT